MLRERLASLSLRPLYELLFGELDDARAAVRYVSSLEGADPKRVVVFGHSAGGMLAAMAALYPDLAALDTGSAGGLYDARIFDHLARPFIDSAEERRLRLFEPFAERLAKPHFACVGDQDAYPRSVAERLAEDAKRNTLPLTVRVVGGNRISSFAPCVEAFVERILPSIR